MPKKEASSRLLRFKQLAFALSHPKLVRLHEHPVRLQLLMEIFKRVHKKTGSREEINELRSWVDTPPKQEIAELAEGYKSWLKEKYHLGDKAVEEEFRLFKQSWGLGKSGRPATKRPRAVIALDKWICNSGKSWRIVTREVCNCGAPEHDALCVERLRQQVNDLRACLKKYGIKEPHRRHLPA